MKLRSLSRKALHSHLGLLAVGERELAAEIIEGVREAERRRLYFDYDHTSLFAYLTESRGFANGSAQRYIDAARLYAVVPTLKEDIARGDLNLSQVTVVAKSVRQKKREEPKFKFEADQATALFERIKGEDTRSSQQILAQELKIEIKAEEIARAQADGSVRREITFSKEGEEALQRIKELISHIHPNPSFAEVFNYLAQEFLKRNDPLVVKGRAKKEAKGRAKKKADGNRPKSNEAAMDDHQGEVCARPSAQAQTVERVGRNDTTQPNHYHLEVVPTPNQEWKNRPKPQSRTYISVETVRFVYQRDQSCRWKSKETGQVCGSKFQLQPDHIQPRWAGGSDEPENLQLLCSKHNRLKYRREAGIKWS